MKQQLHLFTTKPDSYYGLDTCLRRQKLSALHVDEAYRFIYVAPFGPYKHLVTITKKTDTYKLRNFVYQSDNGDVCTIIEQFDKDLNVHDWNKITGFFYDGDLWGMKEDNGRHGHDGDDLSVEAYKKDNDGNNAKYSRVHCWIPPEKGIREAYNYILLKSESRKGCVSMKENK